MVERSPQIEALFAPYDVRAFTADAAETWVGDLHDGELPGTQVMSEGRRAEFATGRACARAAMADLGLHAPLPRQDGGAPYWPVSVAGSISHTQGFCAAVASTDSIALGIDVEEIGRISQAVERRILIEAEQLRLHPLSVGDRQRHVASIFAIKEAFYKAHYEVEPRYLGFDAIEVRVVDDEDQPTEIAIGHNSGDVDRDIFPATRGRVAVMQGRIVAAVVIDTSGFARPLPSPA